MRRVNYPVVFVIEGIARVVLHPVLGRRPAVPFDENRFVAIYSADRVYRMTAARFADDPPDPNGP